MNNAESIYIKNKYTNLYFKIIHHAKENPPNGYTEKHHIIPRSLGGSDCKSNLVKLSARQHYICHLLLTKMVEYNSPEYHKMVKAYMMMANMKGDNQERTYKVNSKLYESLKVKFSNIISIEQSGTNNSQFGTMWIYNPTIRESKKINKNEIIPNGWFKGRVLKIEWDTHFTQRKCKVCDNNGTMSKMSDYCSKECRYKHTRQTMTLLDKIHKSISIISDCHIWIKSCTSSGFPQQVHDGKNYQVGRFLYEHANNIKINSKLIIKHTCNNKKCVNPEHMYIVSYKDNYDIHIESHRNASIKKRGIWIINNIQYDNLRIASEKTKLSKQTILNYTNDGIFDIDLYRINCKKSGKIPKV